MAWNVNVDEVLKRWIGEAPDSDDDVLLTLISDAVVLINIKVKNISERLERQDDLQILLNMIVSTMVQRAYNSDYSTYNSQSFTTGPFSESYSKGSENKQGLFLTNDELSLLQKDESAEPSRIAVIKNPASPNFYVSRFGWSVVDDDCW